MTSSTWYAYAARTSRSLPIRAAPKTGCTPYFQTQAVGDFNTHLYRQVVRDRIERLGRPIGDPTMRVTRAMSRAAVPDAEPFPCLDKWAALQGSKDMLSAPSTATNYPDVIYIHRKTALAVGITAVGSFLHLVAPPVGLDAMSSSKTPLQNYGAIPLPREGRLFGGSDHKPIFATLFESRKEPVDLKTVAA